MNEWVVADDGALDTINSRNEQGMANMESAKGGDEAASSLCSHIMIIPYVCIPEVVCLNEMQL